MTRRIASLFCLLFVFGQAAAHEFWLNPSTLTPVPGEAFRVGLMHGERFAGDAVPRPASFERFVVALPDGAEHAVVGMAGRDVSFAKVPAEHAGGGTVVYESAWTTSRLPAKRFDAYLQEEKLGHISRERERFGETGTAGAERYKRCSKALLGQSADGETGLPLEIVVLSSGAGEIRARMLLRGEALSGIRVVLAARAQPESLVEAVTDEDGLVSFALEHDGRLMLTTLHMERAPADIDADWQSFWASTVFER